MTLCDTCSKANVCCPIYPQDTTSCVEYSSKKEAKVKYSPGPWEACHDGKCKCKSVWNDNHPIATVESGEWGDEYPAIREGEDGEPEAYAERIVYGTIDEESAQGNARLIAAAPEMLELLKTLEYANLTWNGPECAICGHQSGHAEDCELGNLLACLDS
jgi:hypothetical protein